MPHVELEATSHCNTRCLHCPHEAISRPAGRMTWETYAGIIAQIRAHVGNERYSISYSGMGEPLLNPLIYRFIRHISHEATTSFASNGSALTEQNVASLIEAGLDNLYLSFNGDEPEVYSRMMGGLSFERVLANVRRAVGMTRNSRLKIMANVSITKANQDRVSRITALLESEQVGPVSYSLCHSRGGNLRDESVCDTPPMGVDGWECDVMKNTLFLDWQGKAHICDHDLHGEYLLGDLMSEPLSRILERRKTLLGNPSSLRICRDCNDIMKVGGTFPLESRSGGTFRDWMFYLFKDLENPLEEANDAMKWIFKIYQKENRTDRLVNRLIGFEEAADRELQRERGEYRVLLADRDRLSRDLGAVIQETERIQRSLEERDREFARLHADYVAIRRSLLWRVASMVNNDWLRLTNWVGRIRRPGYPPVSKEAIGPGVVL